MQIEWLPLDLIIPFEENPKRPNSTIYEQLTMSIRQFGLVLPLHVIPHEDGEHYLLADGHQRFHIIENMGWETGPFVIHEHISRAELPEFIEAIGNTTAGWDKAKLKPLLERLQNRLPDLLVTGFSPEEARKLIDSASVSAAHVSLKPKPTNQKRRISAMLRSKDYDLVSTVLAEIMSSGCTEAEAFVHMIKTAADEYSSSGRNNPVIPNR